MLSAALPVIAAVWVHPIFGAGSTPVVQRASLSIPDTLFLFVIALVVFGPRRLPEIGKQIGKLVFEFRRASNDFKLQIEEELRLSEQQERQKQLEAQAAATPRPTPVALSADTTTSAAEPATLGPSAAEETPGLSVQPPSTGAPVPSAPPNRTTTSEADPPASFDLPAETTPVNHG